ncbi:MAG: class I SAM-dependent methyltransferase [bacterium]|nr:class I SAM-dependent methyltransferase [bacterium]
MTEAEPEADPEADPVRAEPYAGLAPIYDYVMRHVDYAHWARFVQSLLRRHHADTGHLLELACGTGNVACALGNLGYCVTGFDISQEMVEEARKKTPAPPGALQFDVRDLRDLRGIGAFDGAICLYDSFNYLLTLSDFDRALGQVYDVLTPGAVFIFDVCTEQNSVRHFGDVRDTEQGPGFLYTRHSYYDADERLQFNKFDIRLEDGSRRQESHVQRIYPHEDLLAHIDASPFDLLEALDGFSLRPGSERSDRIHFVLRRQA